MKEKNKQSALNKPRVHIRVLTEKDLQSADHIFRLAFGTWNNLPDPIDFGGNANYCRTRWLIDSGGTFGAEIDGELVGSNFATNWGSLGFFGPLSVHPDLWDKGIAQQLLEATIEILKERKVRHIGFFTHPDSPKHIFLYQKFDFWPRFLTAIMSMPVESNCLSSSVMYYSDLRDDEKYAALNACREVTDSIFEGLDLSREITAADIHVLGETLLLWDNSKLAGFAVCHCGAGTEAGSDSCYVKFGAVRSGSNAAKNFDLLLDACEAMAADKGMSRLIAGVNTARYRAYKKMLEIGFKIDMLGISMNKPNEPGYSRPEVFIIDDWR